MSKKNIAELKAQISEEQFLAEFESGVM